MHAQNGLKLASVLLLGIYLPAGCRSAAHPVNTAALDSKAVLARMNDAQVAQSAAPAAHDALKAAPEVVLASYAAAAPATARARQSSLPFLRAASTQPTPAREVEVLPAPAGENTARAWTLTDLEAVVLAHHPALAEAAARVAALQGKQLQVGLPPNPKAGYDAQDMGLDGGEGQHGAFVSQEIVTGGKLGLNRAVVGGEVRVAEQQFAAQRQRVLTDVRLGFHEVLVADRRLALAKQLDETAHKVLETSEKRKQAMLAPELEVLQARVEADTVRNVAAEAEARRNAAVQRLAAAAALPGLHGGTLLGDPDNALPNIEPGPALARILGQSPRMAAAYMDIERAQAAVQRARAEFVPNLELMASVRKDSVTDDTVADAQVGVPLPFWNRNQGGIRQAESELAAAQRKLQRTELALRRDFATVFGRYTAARQQVERYQRDILPNAESAQKLVHDGYLAGQLDFLPLLTAQRTYFQTRLGYLEALREMWAAADEIEGLLLSGSLEEPAND